MKRVLLTGGAGFVGANLARRLLEEGHEVHLLLRPGADTWRLDGIVDAVRIHAADLEDGRAVASVAGAAAPEWIFHLAAHGAYSWQTGAGEMARTNVAGTVNLVEACVQRGFEAFVHAGSSSEYGFKEHAPSEEERLDPASDYAVTKAAATLFCRHAARRHRVPLVTLRLYSVFGPFEDPRRFMPALILGGLAGELPPLVQPDRAHDWIYVDDVLDACCFAARRTGLELGAIYNVGTGVQTRIRDVVDVARAVLGIEALPDWGSMPDRAWDTDVWVADTRKIRAALGWAPRHTFEEGFRRMAEWFRENPAIQALYGRMAAWTKSGA